MKFYYNAKGILTSALPHLPLAQRTDAEKILYRWRLATATLLSGVTTFMNQ